MGPLYQSPIIDEMIISTGELKYTVKPLPQGHFSILSLFLNNKNKLMRSRGMHIGYWWGSQKEGDH
jgi:hypothetical protein